MNSAQKLFAKVYEQAQQLVQVQVQTWVAQMQAMQEAPSQMMM